MDLLSFIIVGVLIWFLYSNLATVIRNPIIFILAIVGLGFLSGDDNCEL